MAVRDRYSVVDGPDIETFSLTFLFSKRSEERAVTFKVLNKRASIFTTGDVLFEETYQVIPESATKFDNDLWSIHGTLKGTTIPITLEYFFATRRGRLIRLGTELIPQAYIVSIDPATEPSETHNDLGQNKWRLEVRDLERNETTVLGEFDNLQEAYREGYNRLRDVQASAPDYIYKDFRRKNKFFVIYPWGKVEEIE